MKYKEIVQFIKQYLHSNSFDSALECVIGSKMNNERLDIYEKLLIYCPELTDKSKKYINDRIDKNKHILAKRSKMITDLGMNLEKEKKEGINKKLENWLEDRQNILLRNQTTIGEGIQEPIPTVYRINYYDDAVNYAINQEQPIQEFIFPIVHQNEIINYISTRTELERHILSKIAQDINIGSIRIPRGTFYHYTLDNGHIFRFDTSGTIIEIL